MNQELQEVLVFLEPLVLLDLPADLVYPLHQQYQLSLIQGGIHRHLKRFLQQIKPVQYSFPILWKGQSHIFLDIYKQMGRSS
jgi:hypothetical protein